MIVNSVYDIFQDDEEEEEEEYAMIWMEAHDLYESLKTERKIQ